MTTSSGHLEGLGETLIPAINRLQDIFSQVCIHWHRNCSFAATAGVFTPVVCMLNALFASGSEAELVYQSHHM